MQLKSVKDEELFDNQILATKTGMSIIIGIDAAISSTKIIGIENGKRIMAPISIPSSDVISSVYGALGKYLVENNTTLGDIEHIMLTGVGASSVKLPLHDCPTTFVDEFKANGLGARFDSGLDHLIVVSMGTGTSLVRVDGDEISHIGGIGMGGGTLLGLSQLLLHTTDVEEITYLADDGYPSMVNLQIRDVCQGDIDGLIGEATASLFANVLQKKPSLHDIAAGLIHMVLETIGSCAVLSQLNGGIKDFVLIGRLTELSSCKYVFPMLEKLYDVQFHIPKYAPYCTALGAALSYRYENG